MQNTLTAAVILIGNELLSGSIQDQNLAHIAKKLEKRGVRVRETRIIPDIESEIIDAVNALREKFDYVFTTGGIGPTHDDITSDSVAKAFGVPNVVQPSVYEAIENVFKRKEIPFTEEAQRMAYAPEGATMLNIKSMSVPGYQIGNVFVMAGVPRIMRIQLESVIETLDTGLEIFNSSVHANVGEGEIAAALEQIQNQHPNVDIGSYPQDPDSEISDYRAIFVVKGTDQSEIDQACNKILNWCQANTIDAEHFAG